MKHIGTKLSIILATTLIGSAALANHPATDDEPTFRQKILGAYDTDHDGRISDSEFAAIRAARKQAKATRQAEALKLYDADRNGKLAGAEIERRNADRKARLLPQFDANKNGVLDKGERRTMVYERLQIKLGHRFTMMPLRYDVNRDGSLQPAEMPGKPGKKQTRFRRMDTDKDGSLERPEFKAHMTKAFKVKQAKKVKKAKLATALKRKGHKR